MPLIDYIATVLQVKRFNCYRLGLLRKRIFKKTVSAPKKLFCSRFCYCISRSELTPNKFIEEKLISRKELSRTHTRINKKNWFSAFRKTWCNIQKDWFSFEKNWFSIQKKINIQKDWFSI